MLYMRDGNRTVQMEYTKAREKLRMGYSIEYDDGGNGPRLLVIYKIITDEHIQDWSNTPPPCLNGLYTVSLNRYPSKHFGMCNTPDEAIYLAELIYHSLV